VGRFVRVGGRATTGAGRSIIWSVAEGGRGRRYREVVRARDAIAHSVLLEVDPDGRFSHLELSTPAGLLTLHPEGDGTLHGHAVVDDGVKHVAGLQWQPEAIVVIDDSVVCVLAAAQLLQSTVAPGSSVARQAAKISPSLAVEVGPIAVARAAATWQLGANAPIEIDGSGEPRLNGGETWPLEGDGSSPPEPRQSSD
jgi:hypothetical protein